MIEVQDTQIDLWLKKGRKIPNLLGDERRLKQVLINLIRNAIKFTSHGYIKVKAYYYHAFSESALKVLVEDTGTGLTKEEIDQLFKRYSKLERTAAINSEGLGLGLTIVKQIVELASGSVSVTSPGPNKGSTFEFVMNLKTAFEE